MNIVTRATTLTKFTSAVPALAAGHNAGARLGLRLRDAAPGLSLSIHGELSAVEAEWRRFEQQADCTAFQTFDWLATWHRHIGLREGVRPAIAVGHFADGETAFLLPLCVAPGTVARRLCWLGGEVCDYNAPLLARDVPQRLTPDRFLAAWRELRRRLERDPLLRHDWIALDKMPRTIGNQTNPFTYLAVTPNPSGAHSTRLGEDWETFYTAKRSATRRRRDRTKRRHMSGYGDIRFVNAADEDDARRTFETLIEQKRRLLAGKGIADIFAAPGRREFYLDLLSNPHSRQLIHVSRLEIGARCVATNLGLVFGDCYYHLLASYDDGEPARYGPGALHLRELMAHAIGLGLRRFDFTIGDEPYKLEWSDTHLELCDYTAAATWRGGPACGLANARRRLKRFIKQTPWAWGLVSQARSALGALARRRLRILPRPGTAR